MICQIALRHNRTLHATRVIKYANHEGFSCFVLSLFNFLEDNYCSLMNVTLKNLNFVVLNTQNETNFERANEFICSKFYRSGGTYGHCLAELRCYFQ